MDDSMSQVTALIAAGATVSHIMEWLKQAQWFPFLSRTSTTTNKWIAVIAAWGTGVGFGLNTHDYSFAAGGVIHVTIPMAERVQIVGEILNHMTDRLVVMGLFYDAEPIVMSKRLRNVSAVPVSSRHTWNAHEWDIGG